MRSIFAMLAVAGWLCAAPLPTHGQAGGPGRRWRGAGPQPCFGIDEFATQCAAPPRTIAIRAGRLFDSNAGKLLTDQVILIQGERIMAVGAPAQMQIPQGAQIIDLHAATVLPGLIDAHTHMFNTPRPGMSREMSALIATQNTQADLRAGFTSVRDMSSHDNGYADVDIRNAIDKGLIEGPRAQVSTRGIRWGEPGSAPANPLGPAIVHNVDEARAAVRDQIEHGADWIKLFPGGAYSFAQNGTAQYVTTYPLPVLHALIDETPKLSHKTTTYVFGCDSLTNT